MCKPFIATKKMDPYLIGNISGRSYIIEPRYSFLFVLFQSPVASRAGMRLFVFLFIFSLFFSPLPLFLSRFPFIIFLHFVFFYFSSALPHFYLSQPFVWRFSRPFCCRSHSSSYSLSLSMNSVCVRSVLSVSVYVSVRVYAYRRDQGVSMEIH